MIFNDFLKALSQIGDRKFRKVLWIGVALSLALLIGVYALFLMVIQWATPNAIDIPLIGPVEGLHSLLSWASALFMVGLSVFLMMPVASAFTGFFLEDVAAAVEARHYPNLPSAVPVPIWDNLLDSFNFFMLLIGVNVVAILLYPFAGPFIPVVFWAVNGFLLGREYFTLVAMRRLGRQGAKALRGKHAGKIWVAGTLMAAPLSIPIVNLLVPVLGAATFTHFYHRLSRER